MSKILKIKDISFNFDAHPVSGNLITVKGADAIKQSLKNLMFLNIFEKPFSSERYIGIKNFLFENLSGVDLTIIRDDIIDVITRLEERIVLNDVIVSFINESLKIQIYYSIMGDNNIINDDLSFNLGRTR